MNYWVVSPNVNKDPDTTPRWREAILEQEAVFMGWPPRKVKNDKLAQGPKFAFEVLVGDVILIAQGTNDNKRFLACGVVDSEPITHPYPNGLSDDLKFGSYRRLHPFASLERVRSFPSFKHASFAGARQVPAIYQLHADGADFEICKWLDTRLHSRFLVPNEQQEEDEWDNERFFEDPARFRAHKRLERNKRLSQKAKHFHGYKCQACGFEFASFYPKVEKNKYIEAHHLQPLSKLRSKKPVQQDPRKDFVVLCANCHRMIHRTRHTSDIDRFRSELAVSSNRNLARLWQQVTHD